MHGAAQRGPESARPRAQQCGIVAVHRYHSEPQTYLSVLRPGTAAVRIIVAAREDFYG